MNFNINNLRILRMELIMIYLRQLISSLQSAHWQYESQRNDDDTQGTGDERHWNSYEVQSEV